MPSDGKLLGQPLPTAISCLLLGLTSALSSCAEIKPYSRNRGQAALADNDQSDAQAAQAPSSQATGSLPQAARPLQHGDAVVFSAAAVVATIDTSRGNAVEVFERAEITAGHVEAFKPVHGLISVHCKACHVGIIGFANADAAVSLEAVLANELVDTEEPGNSLFVRQMAAGHNNWSTAESDAEEMLTAIEDYLKSRPTNE